MSRFATDGVTGAVKIGVKGVAVSMLGPLGGHIVSNMANSLIQVLFQNL